MLPGTPFVPNVSKNIIEYNLRLNSGEVKGKKVQKLLNNHQGIHKSITSKVCNAFSPKNHIDE
jgi:hypothetical protein